MKLYTRIGFNIYYCNFNVYKLLANIKDKCNFSPEELSVAHPFYFFLYLSLQLVMAFIICIVCNKCIKNQIEHK